MLQLPDLVLFEDYGGIWDEYLNSLYSYFKNDFLDSRPSYNGIKLRLKKHPFFKGKEATFWHFISEGEEETERTPDIRRCERIRWPRPVIENCDHQDIKVWENKRKREVRICLCYGNWDYLVVLAKRKNYILPWTAYPVFKEHQKKKLQKEYENYLKNTNTAS